MAITFDNATKIFYLDGKSITYAFYINPIGYPEHLYLGSRIGHDAITYTRAIGARSKNATPPGRDDLDASEYTYNRCGAELAFFGTGDFREPAVQVQNAAGDRLSDLLYVGHEILPEKPKMAGMPSMSGGETLLLHLRDAVSAFGADLYYTVYPDCDVIARRVVYRNGGKADVTLRRAYSFSMGLPTGEYEFLSLYGSWARERQIERIPLHHGVVSVDSKRTSSSAPLNPFVAVTEKGTTETKGEVFGFSLVYSSSFVLKAEVTANGEAMVTGGINDFDFSWHLAAGETFETPEIVIAYSDEGLGGMSRAYHDAYRTYLINPRYVHAHRPLVVNNWEATYMRFDNEKLIALADAAAGTGIDTFVLDDGWFGARNEDNAGLGDWVVNTDKLKGGLTRIIDHVHEKGMQFGLWFEPEMVNEDSDLYRAHPDYAIKAPDRAPCYGRHQFVLDLTRADVRDYIVNAVNRVLDENDIAYVKWDYNRNVTESFSVGRAPARQCEFAHRYALGLYDICERIILTHPHVFFEGCASGGGRFDGGMLYYFPQIWTSDNTDGFDRARIQWGTSLCYPLSAMSCHVSTCPNHQTGRNTPLETRAAIASLGAFGYELDLTKLSEEEKKQVRQQIGAYQQVQDLILGGDLYRISDPFASEYFCELVVSKDKSKAYVVGERVRGRAYDTPRRVRLKGLNENKQYHITQLNVTASGKALKQAGVILPRVNDFGSWSWNLNEVK